MLDLGDILRLGSPSTPDGEPAPRNDIDATGQCCCAGCIGMGPCDLDQADDDWDDLDDEDDGVIWLPVETVYLPDQDVL